MAVDYSAINSVSSSIANTSTSSSNSTTTAAASEDRFLKLLVAQLNNQDPMNPMDNAQMTSQMAQINTVSGIQTLNDTMKSMATQIAALQSLQGSATIGHDVLTEGSTVDIVDGVGKGSFDLSSNADAVKVEVRTAGGTLLGTVNLGAQEKGRQSFTWDASSYTGGGNPTFKITATSGGKPVTATALAEDTVTSVGTNGTAMSLQLKGRAAVTYDAIQAIL